MRLYSKEEVTALIGCRKRVTQPPRRELRLENGHLRNDMQLESEDGSERFSAFMRINDTFRENFSIGLIYHSKEAQSFQILRCNGPHGDHADLDQESDSHHYRHHVHEITADDLNDGVLAPSKARAAHGYAGFEEALVYFLEMTNVLEIEKYFPPKSLQLGMFEAENE